MFKKLCILSLFFSCQAQGWTIVEKGGRNNYRYLQLDDANAQDQEIRTHYADFCQYAREGDFLECSPHEDDIRTTLYLFPKKAFDAGFFERLKKLAFLEELNIQAKLDANFDPSLMQAFLSDISHFSCLSRLSITYNLRVIPETISDLKTVQEITFSANDLEALPESLGELENLTFLDVRLNRLKTLPQSIGRLKKLKIFLMSHNEGICSVPRDFLNLSLQNGGSLDNIWFLETAIADEPLSLQEIESVFYPRLMMNH